jgi:hypothetical protein
MGEHEKSGSRPDEKGEPLLRKPEYYIAFRGVPPKDFKKLLTQKTSLLTKTA